MYSQFFQNIINFITFNKALRLAAARPLIALHRLVGVNILCPEMVRRGELGDAFSHNRKKLACCHS